MSPHRHQIGGNRCSTQILLLGQVWFCGCATSSFFRCPDRFRGGTVVIPVNNGLAGLVFTMSKLHVLLEDGAYQQHAQQQRCSCGHGSAPSLPCTFLLHAAQWLFLVNQDRGYQ
ncbi:hypothetical protein DL89DRAFT_265727 [Linderina pennispora]|uniref:Uncharacterized protein n=1 Tax=Linderina pennispora TaxID=61395 RepID=A0A1Y1WFQ6_9FUNG|nr:uncharacterized protein DL89DRAFT_265727 [Linderina pennispora]ORX72066.1 hypothetical protein DL89DRAFT_265727 [Linderina pennispora]